MAPSYGLSFGPALIIDGQPQHTETLDLHPRTAVGQLACGSLLFIVIDGGGSATMVYEGKMLSKPSDGRLRVVANNIVVL